MMTVASAMYIAQASTTALGRRSTNTIWRSFPGGSTSTMMKPRTRTAMPTRKYKTVATNPLRTGLRSMVPNSTARYMIISLVYVSAEVSFGPAWAAGGASGAARWSSRVKAGTEKDERAVAVCGGQVLDSDAARVWAVRANRHDCVVVAQVLGARAGGTRRRALIAGQGVGHRGGRSLAQIPRPVCVLGGFAVAGSNKRPDILVLQRYSEYQAGKRREGQHNGHDE